MGEKRLNLLANETLYQLSYDPIQLTIKYLRRIFQTEKALFTTIFPRTRPITCKYPSPCRK